MPIIKSAIKRARQNKIRRERRLPTKSYMKTMLRKLSDATSAKNADEAKGLLPQVYKAIDMAAKRNIIHKKNAARKKSLAARQVAAISS